MQQGDFEHRKGILIFSIAIALAAFVALGALAALVTPRGGTTAVVLFLFLIPLVALASFLVYRKIIFPTFRRLEDANLEMHLKQEELLDTKDDLFIKFLGIYDVNYAANSPRLFASRLKDVADVTAKVMDADACFIYLYDKKKEELVLAATNEVQELAIGNVRIPLGEGVEGWVGRRLEPLMLKDYHADARFKNISGITVDDFVSVYCLPLYVYSNGVLVGLMEVFYRKAKIFSDEEINFFTTLSGILSTTVQNEQMQVELRKMNVELEQWVAEKTEELRSSEERYRSLVENASESIFVLAENGDIVFANDQAALLTGFAKYDLLHKNLFELFVDPLQPKKILIEIMQGKRGIGQGELKKTDGSVVPVDVNASGLLLMGKRFIQSVVRDISTQVHLEKLLSQREKEIADLKARG